MANTRHADKSRYRILVLAPTSEAFSVVARHLEDCVLRLSQPELNLEFGRLEPGGQYGDFVSDVALQIPRWVESADAVIADLTGANPNVMYELGFAHALKKPVLPIVQRGDTSIPSDLQGYLYYVYDPDDLHGLTETITRWLRRTLVESRP